MYPFYNEKNIDSEDFVMPEDCFAEKARNFYWILGILLVGVLSFLIIKYLDNSNTVTVDTVVKQYTNARTVAYSPCPYCPGSLDTLGRCNSSGCPLYSPDWGKTQPAAAAPAAANVPADNTATLIKELAAEVVSVVDGGVIVHSIYIGGNAQKSGLLKGDIITNFNGRGVKNSEQLQKIVSLAKPESFVSVDYLRDGQKFTSKVMIGEGDMDGAVKPVPIDPQAAGAAKPVALNTGTVYPGIIKR
jgi:membrane-associated protease RseP (regulator of RpoE activity)